MSRRNQLVDILRFAGAFGVLIGHFGPPASRLYGLVHFSRAGVVLFFCISGLLVGRNLLRYRRTIHDGAWTRGGALRYFYLRPSLRIFPLYYAVVLVFVAIGYRPVAERAVWHLTYTSNYGQMLGLDMANAAHFWSLCVEEQFYLVVPFLILWTPVRRIPHLLLGLLVVSVGAKVVIAYATHSWLLTTRGLIGNMEGLLVGLLMAHYAEAGMGPRVTRALGSSPCSGVGGPGRAI
jgi:peptidoglycan/LPS O-acetylase OafA/YrhL